MMKKLLLADDSITIQKVVGIIFSTEEYQLEMTDDGDSAFNLALEEKPDLVIADISMPGKDGFELCRAIKSEASLAQTSVLLLPGAFDHFDEAKAGEVCADGWLTKPFESQALLDKVSQLLEAEPVRMAGVVIPTDDATSADEAQVGVTDNGEKLSVDEAALGLDNMDKLEQPVGEIEEESPDDIWDAVSFAEEDLQKPEITDDVDSDDVSFAADIMDPTAIDDVAVELATAKTDEVDFSTPEVTSAFVAEEFESPIVDEFQAEEFVASGSEEETSVEFSDQVESDPQVAPPVFAEEAESVDFSVSSDSEDDFQESTVEMSDAFDDEDVIMELQEEDELDDLETKMQEAVADEDSTVSFAETVENDLSDDDEILDLSMDEIIEDEPLKEKIVEEVAAEELEPFVAGDTELETELEPEPETEPATEIVDLIDEDIELVEEVETLSAVAEDEDFYFDATADDDEDLTDAAAVTAGSVGLATGAAATYLNTDGDDDSATVQVEQQLRELSADELKEVVSKVAGPMIEKLASEMIERIAWEVVPDLAESMISEEIRKIKEGE